MSTCCCRWTCFGDREPRTLDYPTVNLNQRWRVPYAYDHNAHRDQSHCRQTDRRTNIMAITRRFLLMNASRAKKIKIAGTPSIFKISSNALVTSVQSASKANYQYTLKSKTVSSYLFERLQGKTPYWCISRMYFTPVIVFRVACA